MYEISHRHAAGICKNYFESQLNKSPNTIAQIKSLMSYSGFRFKSFRDFYAYYKSATNKLGEIALYTLSTSSKSNSKEMYCMACIATPMNKTVSNSTNGQTYIEDYLKLQFIQLGTDLSQGLMYDLFEYPQHCEITSHSIVRIIQRMKTTQIDNVTYEIRSSAMSMFNILVAMLQYPISRRPRRMVIPSASGAFLVDFDAASQTIFYRTFVKDEMFDFQEQSVNATREWLQKVKKAKSMSPQLASELFNHKSNKWWLEPKKDQKFTDQSLSQ
jgi:hypothetical protein